MEDFSTVIWIIAIVAAMVFNGVSQARKQAKKHAGQSGKHAGNEAWPSWDAQTSAEMQRPAAEETARSAKRAELRPVPAPTVPSEGFGETTGKATDFMQSERLAPNSTTMTAQGSSAAGRAARAHAEATEDAAAEITEDFDLRKAVIYSEILKPKFDE